MILTSLAHAQATRRPVYTGYKGVMIGTTMTDARTKLGTAKDKSDSEDYYVYSENETCQVLYGPDKTVRVISVTYIGKNFPTPMEVLGIDAEQQPNGGINKRVEYPKAGFWISYLKTGGSDPMVIVTAQKMQVVE
jgi:hypothetical protein